MSFGLPDGKSLSYGGYLRVPELLALQECRSQPAQHDETLFIVIHQVYELWFKQLLHEVDAVLGRLDRDDVLHADRMLRRCIEIQRVLVAQLKVLETMTPMDFLAFRDHIMPASGFQSAQFRELEFVSGLKDPRFLAFFQGSPDHDRLQRRLTARTLPDAYHDLLRRRGFDLPEAAAGDDEGLREAKHRRRLEELMRVYREADAHYALFLLSEALIEYDEMFLIWRFRHVQMVERVIGARPGTGGSEGSGYLRTTIERRFFPELWELRSYLGMPGGGAGSGERPIGGAYGAPAAEGDAPPPSGGCPMGH
jgi:tryptophan 2,3-dioxygenase